MHLLYLLLFTPKAFGTHFERVQRMRNQARVERVMQMSIELLHLLNNVISNCPIMFRVSHFKKHLKKFVQLVSTTFPLKIVFFFFALFHRGIMGIHFVGYMDQGIRLRTQWIIQVSIKLLHFLNHYSKLVPLRLEFRLPHFFKIVFASQSFLNSSNQQNFNHLVEVQNNIT